MILKNKKLDDLEKYCKKDPVTHAFTLWDLRRERDSTDFYVYWKENIKGYMLIYYGASIPSIIIHAHEKNVVWSLLNLINLKKAIIHLPYKYINLWNKYGKKYKIIVMARKPEKMEISQEITEIKNPNTLKYLFEDPTYLIEKAKTWGIVRNGIAISSISALAYTPEVWVLGALITKKEYRRQGLASKLISYFINEAYGKTDNIVLWVRDNNIPAINLYKKFNFKEIGVDGWINVGVDIIP